MATFEFQGTQDYSSATAQPKPRQQPGSACEECRRRKLRCDRKQPQCGACGSSGVNCVVRASCPPRGPKKGHLRALRNQIAALEERLDEREKRDGNSSAKNAGAGTIIVEKPLQPVTSGSELEDESSEGDHNDDMRPRALSTVTTVTTDLMSDFGEMTTLPMVSTPMSTKPLQPFLLMDDANTRGMAGEMMTPFVDTAPIGVYLTSLVCTDLDQLYFDRVHVFAPMLQKFRYLAWSRQTNKSKHRVCLQHAVWALAASLSSQFQYIRNGLYKEARQMLDSLEMDTEEPRKCQLEQVQAWILLSIYEFISDDYQRGLLSAGRAFRLAQLMRLHDVDGSNGRTSPLSYSRDWIEVESMRRTFWVVYIIDRFTSVSDGLPLTFKEEEIRTRLPASDAEFTGGRPVTMPTLSEVLGGTDPVGDILASELATSPFTECIMAASLCGRTLVHRHHSLTTEQRFCNTPEAFCQRHQQVNATLASRIKSLSTQILSTSEHPDPMLIFSAITAYTNVFLLCETIESTAVGTAESHALLVEQKQRALDACREMSTLVTVLTQLNQFEAHPFNPIPLLLSARFCLAHMGSNEAYGALMPMIATALQGLANVNSLAKNSVRLLGLGHGSEWDAMVVP